MHFKLLASSTTSWLKWWDQGPDGTIMVTERTGLLEFHWCISHGVDDECVNLPRNWTFV